MPCHNAWVASRRPRNSESFKVKLDRGRSSLLILWWAVISAAFAFGRCTSPSTTIEVVKMERFLYTWLLLLCVFYMAVANQQDFVSQRFGSAGDMTPWLELDLGAPTQISMIRIYNREDCCTERLGTHDVWVGLTSGSPTQQTNTLCYRGTATPDATEIDDYPSNTCFGRYVYIQQFTEYLNLREVEVYGSLSP
ncbi:hypothetical protein CYMTET_16416 [Cymbomonas tetramitiformis]|uniref:F5/8 type C domain-containing protein n=1 Tax=Cymbomonas tetramitiformis TaxID=36881 RepID=A0AAE0GCA5_9CHLO|nr:hypothetical protein CYMTET_16416 [Cymbomonas tetramitiformis]